jgi:hypothetical protein
LGIGGEIYFPSIRFKRRGDVFIQGLDGIGAKAIADKYRQDHPAFSGVLVVQKQAKTEPVMGIKRKVFREEVFRIHPDGQITKEAKE